jgi:ribosomal-protein-alanine N-acetyltransferase
MGRGASPERSAAPRFAFEPMGLEAARAILAWRYEGPYAVYNADPAQLEAGARTWAGPNSGGFALRDAGGEVVGFCSFGADAQVPGGDYAAAGALDVGLGLRPDLTGRGHGLAFVRAILRFGRRRFRPARFRLTVAAFNQRALRVYERAGFRVTHRFGGAAGAPGASRGTWVQLERPAASEPSPKA